MIRIQVDLLETDKMKGGSEVVKLWHLKEASKPFAISIFQVIQTKNQKIGAKIP